MQPVAYSIERILYTLLISGVITELLLKGFTKHDRKTIMCFSETDCAILWKFRRKYFEKDI